MAKAKSDSAARVGYKEIKAALRAGRSQPVYVLYGEETFLIDKLVASLVSLLISPGCEGLDKIILDAGGQASRLDLNLLQAEVMTPPFLSRCKLVIVRHSNLFTMATRKTTGSGPLESAAAADDREAFEEAENDQDSDGKGGKNRQQTLQRIISQVPDSACLVFVEDKVDRRLKQLVTAVESKGVLAEIGREQPRLLRQWVEAECRQRQIMIEELAAESLVDRCDASMQLIWQELTKIFLFLAYTQGHAVDLPLVEQISLPDLRGSIFDMTDAISRGQTGQALELLDRLISQKQPVQLIQFMLTRHFRQLICAAELNRSEAIISQLKVMPFIAGRLLQQARYFNVSQMETIYAQCYETDLLVKTGQMAERLALETLLVSAAETAKNAGRR